VRLASLHGSASPFWAEDSVASSLKVGMRIEYSPRAGPQTSELPHSNDDVWCGSVHPAPQVRSGPQGVLLQRIAFPSLDAVWPRGAVRDSSCRRVHAGSDVPSLAVVQGSVLRYESPKPGNISRAGRASLKVGHELLHAVRCVCPEISAACARTGSSELGAQHILVLGLARVNWEEVERTGSAPACEILLIGWAPCAVARAPASMPSGPRFARKRPRSRASPVPFSSSSRVVWIDQSAEAEQEDDRRWKRQRSW